MSVVGRFSSSSVAFFLRFACALTWLLVSNRLSTFDRAFRFLLWGKEIIVSKLAILYIDFNSFTTLDDPVCGNWGAFQGRRVLRWSKGN